MPECEKCKSKSTYEDGHIHHVKGCEYWDEAPKIPASVVILELLFRWMGCLIGHKWLYASRGPRNGEWHRECQRCGKRQHATYDMMYGSTDWHNGW